MAGNNKRPGVNSVSFLVPVQKLHPFIFQGKSSEHFLFVRSLAFSNRVKCINRHIKTKNNSSWSKVMRLLVLSFVSFTDIFLFIPFGFFFLLLFFMLYYFFPPFIFLVYSFVLLCVQFCPFTFVPLCILPSFLTLFLPSYYFPFFFSTLLRDTRYQFSVNYIPFRFHVIHFTSVFFLMFFSYF